MSASLFLFSQALPCRSRVLSQWCITTCSSSFQPDFLEQHESITTRRFTTTTALSLSQADNNTTLRPTPIKNQALSQVKSLGMSHLQATCLEIVQKTREPLLLRAHGPTPEQVNEANRIFSVLNQVLERYSRNNTTFSIQGEPIVIMEVEVSPDLRQARVYWSLPFGIMGYESSIVDKVREKMQSLLLKRASRLQGLVHAQLRSYYPPKLIWVPYSDDLFQENIKQMAKKKQLQKQKRK